MKISRSALLASLLVFTAAAGAQQQAAQPARPVAARPAPQQQKLTPEQQAQVTRQDAEITKAAAKVVQLVDTSKTGEVWDGASKVAKNLVNRQTFVSQISADRKKLGAPAERKRVAVTRSAYTAGGQVPAGNYINVVYATKFANAPQPVRELVSFHLDDDKTWRVSGYSLR
ncbi:DUF4019 domain-containing protein [Pseudoxanthomonas gei]|uniref:DUF4019 domain-containing protein n=1 Tax=Pseudoxanthomonas gei TaxID=1383030 RepID=UPI001B87CDC2|nr:DUF4019 domain-containing protein [Pseudoxanthomonas gei]